VTSGSREIRIERGVAHDCALDPEAARLPAAALSALSAGVGRQVRLRRGRECALFTVVGRADRVELAPGGAALVAGDGPLFAAGEATTPPDDAPAGTFLGTVRPGGDLLAVAPHGGFIEPRTDDQAARAGALGATAWHCRGAWPGDGRGERGGTGETPLGGAFARWHVTSTDLHPGSFPGLARVAERGPYAAAVSFHGWRHDGVGVGGGAPRALHDRVIEALRGALPAEVPVRSCAGGPYAGSDPANVVNRFARDRGVQIESSARVRLNSEPRRAVAAAVVASVRGWLDERA